MSHLVAAPSCARGSPLQEERNVRSELGREAPKFLAGSIQREQSIRAEEKSRGVAASPSESGRDGDALGETYAHAARWVSRRKQRPCPLENVGPFAGNR